MAKFTVEWDDGRVETVEQSDCNNLEQFLNTRFGAGKGIGEIPAKIVLESGEEEVKPTKKATKK